MQTALMNVRFEGNNGHDAEVTRCLLMTQSGHQRLEGPTLFFASWAQKFRKLASSESALATRSSGIGMARRRVLVMARFDVVRSRAEDTGVGLTELDLPPTSRRSFPT